MFARANNETKRELAVVLSLSEIFVQKEGNSTFARISLPTISTSTTTTTTSTTTTTTTNNNNILFLLVILLLLLIIIA